MIAFVNVLVAAACATGGPAYERELFVRPRTTPLVETIELYLVEQGYDVRDRIPRSMSVTTSALKIRAGRDRGVLWYDWLHVTVSQPSRATGFGDPSLVVDIRGETEREDRERTVVEPSAEVIADADRLAELLARGP